VAAVIPLGFRAFRGDDRCTADGKVATVAVAPVSVDNIGSRRADPADEQRGDDRQTGFPIFSHGPNLQSMTCEAHLAIILHHIHRSRNNYWLESGRGPTIFEGSVTVYDGTTQLLIKNSIDRHLINTPMLPRLKKNADGSLTLDIQKKSPCADR
jgi:Protein of unknown function (DUF1214)